MRQGQQHRRGRTRGGQNNNHGNNNSNNQNRKGQNPISRTYQSNGPDGKVSGTASGIADKYLSLARDATTSGDPVLAENYLQHAEHYNRIILAYRESQTQTNDENGQPRQRMGQPGDAQDGSDDQGDDEVESYGRDMQPLPPVDLPQRSNDQPPRSFDNTRSDQRPEGRQDSRQDNRSDNRPDNRQDQPGRFDDRQPRFNDGQQRRNNQPRERYQQGGGERFNNGDRGNNDRFSGQPRADRFQNDRNQHGDRNQADRQPFVDRQTREPGFMERQGERPYRDGNAPRSDNRPDSKLDSRPDGRAEFRGEQRHEPSRHEPARPEPRPDLPVRDVVRPEAPAFRPDPPAFRPDAPVFPEVSRIDHAVGSEQPQTIGSQPVVRTPRPPRRERAPPTVVAEHEQPEFLRRPVRRPRRDVAASAEDVPPAAPTKATPGDD